VVKEKLGTKQTCPNCEARFYDLGRNPAVCPKCEQSHQPEPLMPRSRAGSERAANSAATAEKPAETPAAAKAPVLAEKAEPVVTFEEADAETSDVKRSGAPSMDDENIKIKGEVEVEDDNDEDSRLLDKEDDFDGDVSGIVDTDIDK
jgi:uncharacterized protein (TIGR02300 family)